MHTISKLLRLVEIRQLALHPDQIRIRRVGICTVDRTLAAATVPVVALPRPRRVPIKMDIHTRQPLRNRARLGITLSLGLLAELRNHALLVDVHAGVDGVGDGFVEEFQPGLLVPRVFDGLQVRARFAGRFGVQHQVVQRLDGRVGRAEDVRVVARVDRAGDEGGGFGIGAGYGKEVGACWIEGVR